MERRNFLATAGVLGVTVVAGCSEGDSGDGSNDNSGGGSNEEVVVDETVYEGDIQRYNFEVEEGQTISVSIDNIEGARTTVVLTNPDDEGVGTFEAETENTGTHEASMTGVFAVNITTLGEARVEVRVE
ncbi:twin-arginine translocation signal domain-containing protein [Halovenus sp. HT40]|uniref:twin-arginine translocation signal domain-containing protein n=1 Tax=Halovenus sp. HT40 TaxID=3126691 RepID=UPI00300F3E65